eukprot:maker-scaffold199_size265817-snap-gene-1.50 protein:Tk08937 transcript:maker-scaffold199_size265817-snap-gene-1.50-mRNA-1 annotation:"receptor-type tyrosine-protein phosphatase kappa-like"
MLKVTILVHILVVVTQSGAQRVFDCAHHGGTNALLEVQTGDNVTLTCSSSEPYTGCSWIPSPGSSNPSCTVPLSEGTDAPTFHLGETPNFQCRFRPNECTIEFTSISPTQTGVWTLTRRGSNQDRVAFWYVAIHVKDQTETTGARSLLKDEEAAGCWLENVGFNDKAAVLARIHNVKRVELCQMKCADHSECVFWTWTTDQMKGYAQVCLLRSSEAGLGKVKPNAISGPKFCPGHHRDRDPRTMNEDQPPYLDLGFSMVHGVAIVGVIAILIVLVAMVSGVRAKTANEYIALERSLESRRHPIPVCKFRNLQRRKFIPLKNELSKLNDEDRAKNLISKPRDVGKSKENFQLNRVGQIIPYDRNRVILSSQVNGSDYINASWITCLGSALLVIATQCPTKDTMDRYWQMIIQENIGVIVSLDESIGWPKTRNETANIELGEERMITLKALSTQSDRRGSLLKTECELNPSSRTLQHFSFSGWNHQGHGKVPKNRSVFCNLIEAVLHLSETLGSSNTVAPILVQCQNGSSKCGLFLACLSLAREIGLKREISVYETVFSLRECRTQLVPSEDQYEALYGIVGDLCQSIPPPEASPNEEGYDETLATAV